MFAIIIMVPVLRGHHTVFFKYDPLVNRKYPNRCPKQFETACEGFSVSSGRDGGRAELCSFMYLFIYFLQEGRRSVFVCSVSTSMFLKVHRGTLRKAPTGGGGTSSCSRWTSLALFANNEPSPPLPLLDGKRERLLRSSSSAFGNAVRPRLLFDQPPC